MEDLSKYRIVEAIGEGAYATVYRALDKDLEREVALKVLHPALMADQIFVAQFQREARIASRLQHPNIVSIFDIAQENARLFLAMALANGPSLTNYIEQKEGLEWKEVKELTSYICGALQYAHDQNILHRDIKPQNILIHNGKTPWLTDFGLAKIIGNNSLSLRISGGVVGTPAYIAPEIWEGEDATPASEIYALSCILFEMLTGKVLFTGNTPMQIMRAHDKGVQLSTTLPGGTPYGILTILECALSRDPKSRFSTVREFHEALIDIDVTVISINNPSVIPDDIFENEIDAELGVYDYLLEADETIWGLNDWLVQLSERTNQVSQTVNERTAEYLTLRGQRERGNTAKIRTAISAIATAYDQYARLISSTLSELTKLWSDLEVNSTRLFSITSINNEDDLNAAQNFVNQVNQTRNQFAELRNSMKRAREQTSKMRGISRDLSNAVGRVAIVLDKIISEFSEGDNRLQRVQDVVQARIKPPGQLEL